VHNFNIYTFISKWNLVCHINLRTMTGSILNRVLKKIQEMDCKGWLETFLCGEVSKLYSSPSIFHLIKWEWIYGGTWSTNDEYDKCLQNFGREFWKKDETWNMRHSWENNTKVCIKQIYWEFLDAIHLVQNRR